MVLIFPRAFNVAPPLTITPFRAHAAARPATYVTGVLIVKAHGQASENYDQTIHRPEMTSVITDQPRKGAHTGCQKKDEWSVTSCKVIYQQFCRRPICWCVFYLPN
jgi:hypothetical protein